MTEKLDFWEKVKIATGFFSGVVLVAIPIAIQVGASNIAQSLETGRIIQQLITDLTRPSEKTRQDIALVALDAAIKPDKKCKILWLWECQPNARENDQVVSIAVIILKDLQGESEQAKAIIKQRMPEDKANSLISGITRPNAISSLDPNLESSLSFEQAAQTEQAAKIAADVLAPPTNQLPESDFTGIRIVYIQYRSNVEEARAIQDFLRNKGITVADLEKVDGITENSIRYSNSSYAATAKRVQETLEVEYGLSFVDPINLNSVGYRVPDGQFEIWLKN
jgi:hypothetical protein